MFVRESFFFPSHFPKKNRLRFCYRSETSFETFGKFHSQAYNRKLRKNYEKTGRRFTCQSRIERGFIRAKFFVTFCN